MAPVNIDVKISMNPLRPSETVVKEGTYLYDEIVECDRRIVHSPVRYGTGDYAASAYSSLHTLACDVGELEG